jgi:hypothetical protein
MSEYISKAPELQWSPDNCKSEAAHKFVENGFTVLKDIFDVCLIEHMRAFTESSFLALQDHLHNNNLVLGIGIKEGFKEVVQRHLNRFEMPYRMEDCMFDTVVNSPAIQEVVRDILGPDFTIVNRSLVLSLPGATVSIV